MINVHYEIEQQKIFFKVKKTIYLPEFITLKTLFQQNYDF